MTVISVSIRTACLIHELHKFRVTCRRRRAQFHCRCVLHDTCRLAAYRSVSFILPTWWLKNCQTMNFTMLKATCWQYREVVDHLLHRMFLIHVYASCKPACCLCIPTSHFRCLVQMRLQRHGHIAVKCVHTPQRICYKKHCSSVSARWCR